MGINIVQSIEEKMRVDLSLQGIKFRMKIAAFQVFYTQGNFVESGRFFDKMQEEVTAFFVHDYESREWIRAETAHFVLSDSLTTPMLSGLAAFASIEQADAFATEVGGKMLTFEELLAQQ